MRVSLFVIAFIVLLGGLGVVVCGFGVMLRGIEMRLLCHGLFLFVEGCSKCCDAPSHVKVILLKRQFVAVNPLFTEPVCAREN